MLKINKQNVLNDDNEITSVLIDYKDFLLIEETLENHGLVKLIEENKQEAYLNPEAAIEYYKKQKELT